jgi:hypothetical protein
MAVALWPPNFRVSPLAQPLPAIVMSVPPGAPTVPPYDHKMSPLMDAPGDADNSQLALDFS